MATKAILLKYNEQTKLTSNPIHIQLFASKVAIQMKGKNRMKRFKVQVYWPQPWAYQTCGHISYIVWHRKLSRMKKYCAFNATTNCKCWFKQLHMGECTLQCTQFEWNLEHIISKVTCKISFVLNYFKDHI